MHMIIGLAPIMTISFIDDLQSHGDEEHLAVSHTREGVEAHSTDSWWYSRINGSGLIALL